MAPGIDALSSPRYGRPLRGRLTSTAIESRCLRGTRFGEPTDRELLVYLPPGYEESGERYPVVLMLPAFGSSHRSAAGYDAWKPNTFERLDAQIVAGECAPLILALPDVMTRWGGGQYVDSSTSGAWQTFLAEEVIPHIDKTFRTVAEAGGRGVVGRSSGGFGALRLAMDRPGLVSALASQAGDALFDVSMRPMLSSAAVAYHSAGGFESWAARIDESGPKSPLDFDGLFVFACSAAYAPNDDASFPYCDLPFETNGVVREDVWARWLAHDPVPRVSTSAGALRELSTIFVDAGESDEHGLQFAAAALRDALREVGAPVHFEEHPGGHRGTSWRYEVSLPHIASQLVRARKVSA